jgi:hypothetical protein
MAPTAAVVCLFRQAIEQTSYWKKVNRCCNGNRDHPSEPTRHTPHNSTLQQPGTQAAAHPPAFPTSPNMVNAENGKREAQKGPSMKKVFRAFGPRRDVPLLNRCRKSRRSDDT